ncbi:MAG: Fur family transcriptional regulator [Chloroflexi bacterium]|nr:Fur family transcriptional regulator [Chloroflexota bacterium]
MTTQRRLILASLDALDTHPTAEELHAIAVQQDPSLNLSTVYRTLRWLEQEGLVSTRRFDEPRRQDRFDPMLPSQHHHFICKSCKNVIEFDLPALGDIQQDFEHLHQVRIESASVVFYGLCTACNRQNGPVESEAERELSQRT